MPKQQEKGVKGKKYATHNLRGQEEYSAKRWMKAKTLDEAVTLQAPDYISLEKLLDKRILATGNYNQKQKILIIQDAIDLEILSTSPLPIPTSTPLPEPTPTQTPIITPSSVSTTIPTNTPPNTPISTDENITY